MYCGEGVGQVVQVAGWLLLVLDDVSDPGKEIELEVGEQEER